MSRVSLIKQDKVCSETLWQEQKHKQSSAEKHILPEGLKAQEALEGLFYLEDPNKHKIQLN